jgi:hypothetical protein
VGAVTDTDERVAELAQVSLGSRLAGREFLADARPLHIFQ